MKTFQDFLNTIDNPTHQQTIKDVLSWVQSSYPQLASTVKWNQPMFTDHDTYIIGFSVSKNHFALSPETFTIQKFSSEIKKAGYDYTENIIRINWNQQVDYKLLKTLIEFNIKDKKNTSSFWRKS